MWELHAASQTFSSVLVRVSITLCQLCGEAVEPDEEESPAGLWEEAQKDDQGMERKVPVFLPVEVINRSGASRAMLLLCEEDNS